MSLPVALALFALLVSVFAVLAAFAVYSRLRVLEHTVLNQHGGLLADDQRVVPDVIHPQGEAQASLVLLLDATCPLCRHLTDTVSEAVQAQRLGPVTVFGLVPTSADVAVYDDYAGIVTLANADAWSSLYESYAPCLYLIDKTGSVTERRFIYGDTDVNQLLTTLALTSGVLQE